MYAFKRKVFCSLYDLLNSKRIIYFHAIDGRIEDGITVSMHL